MAAPIGDPVLPEEAGKPGDRLRDALDTVAVGVAVVGTDGRFLDVNDTYCRTLKASREDLLSRTYLDVTHQEDRAVSEAEVRSLLEGKTRSFVLEKRYTALDGETVWGRASVFLARDPEERPLHLVALIEDITERKRAERALERKERDFADLVNSINGIVWEADPDTIQFSFVSRQAEDILGHPVRAWLEDPDFWASHVHPDDREWVVPMCREASRERRDHTFEYRMIAADGSTVWLHDVVRVVPKANGTATLRGIMVDITERKDTERALKASEGELRALMECAPIGILRSTPKGRILSANPALARILGLDSVDEVLELDLPTDVYADAAERQRIARAVGGDEYHTAEARWIRADGETIHVRMRTHVVRTPEGEVDTYETFVEDVTERRRLEAHLRQSRKMEAVGRLAGGVAHDFNNVLTAITGECQLLLEQLDEDEPARREAEEILRAAQRAADLTRQLLAFSRRQVMQPEVVDLNELVRSARRMLRRIIGEDIELVSDLDEELRSVTADPAQLEQVIVNLAVNGRDAMPDGGTLTLRTENVTLDEAGAESLGLEAPGGYVRLSVSDTGEGMDPETASRSFEPFFTTKEGDGGTGLGLATVYGIATQSGGQVAVTSEVGRGTTFEIYLPASEGPTATDSEPTESVEGSRVAGDGETVLLVEDDDAVRRVARLALEGYGYRVLEAEDGEGALRRAREHDGAIDLLISDMVLPGVDGIVVAELLRERRPDLRLLFVSGYASEAARDHPILESAGYLSKPFTPESLARTVRETLDA